SFHSSSPLPSLVPPPARSTRLPYTTLFRSSLNSRALERAADLAGVRGFEVDASGRPTGLLTEDAFGDFHLRFETGEAGIERGLPAVARMAHRLGITSIHDVVGRAGWTAYQRLHHG